ncbi:MAG: hypothetical protein Fur0024_4710 [Patescibacteria group bacterium]
MFFIFSIDLFFYFYRINLELKINNICSAVDDRRIENDEEKNELLKREINNIVRYLRLLHQFPNLILFATNDAEGDMAMTLHAKTQAIENNLIRYFNKRILPNIKSKSSDLINILRKICNLLDSQEIEDKKIEELSKRYKEIGAIMGFDDITLSNLLDLFIISNARKSYNNTDMAATK